MEKTQTKRVEPHRHFITHLEFFSEEWLDHFSDNAAHDIMALEKRFLPLCTVFGVHGGRVENFFDVLQDSKLELSVYVFLTDEDMDIWADEFGREKIRFMLRAKKV